MKAEEKRAMLQANARQPLPEFKYLPPPENLIPYTNTCVFCGAALDWVECKKCWAVMGEYIDPPGRRFIRYPPATEISKRWNRFWLSLSTEARIQLIEDANKLKEESDKLWNEEYDPRQSKRRWAWVADESVRSSIIGISTRSAIETGRGRWESKSE